MIAFPGKIRYNTVMHTYRYEMLIILKEDEEKNGTLALASVFTYFPSLSNVSSFNQIHISVIRHYPLALALNCTNAPIRHSARHSSRLYLT